jgi:hypothetical protein
VKIILFILAICFIASVSSIGCHANHKKSCSGLNKEKCESTHTGTGGGAGTGTRYNCEYDEDTHVCSKGGICTTRGSAGHDDHHEENLKLREFLITAVNLAFDRVDGQETDHDNPLGGPSPGLVKNIQISNNIPLLGTDTLELVITTFDPTDNSGWKDIFPVAWKVVTFNRQSTAGSVTYKDSYTLSVPQIDSGNRVIPATEISCSIGEKLKLTGLSTNYLWESEGKIDLGVTVTARNAIPSQFYNMAFAINGKTAAVKKNVPFDSSAQFKPTPVLYFTITNDYEESEVIQSVITSKTFRLDLINYSNRIQATLAIAADGSRIITFDNL